MSGGELPGQLGLVGTGVADIPARNAAPAAPPPPQVIEGCEAFAAARYATNRRAFGRYLKSQNIKSPNPIKDSPEVFEARKREKSEAKARFNALTPLIDPTLERAALAALGFSIGPPVGSLTVSMTLWKRIDRTHDGLRCNGTWLDFVEDVQAQADLVVEKGAGIVFNPSTNRDGHRCDESTETMHALLLDADGQGDWLTLLARLQMLGYSYVAYRSSSHAPGLPKWRVVLFLARPFSTATPEDRLAWRTGYATARTVFGALARLSGPGFDATTDGPFHGWYFGNRRTPDAPAREVVVFEGASLDLHALLDVLPPVEEVEKREIASVASEHLLLARDPLPVDCDDPSLLHLAFAEAGMLGCELSPGKYSVLCPWNDAHTNPLPDGAEPTSSTVIFPASTAGNIGFFHCSHSCGNQPLDEVLAALPEEAVEEARLIHQENLAEYEARAAAEASQAGVDAPKIIKLREQLDEPRAKLAPATAQQKIEAVFRGARVGVTVLRASCGAGKTTGAVEVAAERARNGQRTAITTATHRVAIPLVEELREAGAQVIRRFAPHTLLDDETNEPVCKFVDEAEIVGQAGLGVKRELCRGVGAKSPCTELETCPAADGADKDPHPLVWVGPHQLLHEAIEFLGQVGLLIIDEPPSPVETPTIHQQDWEPAFDATEFLNRGPVLKTALEAVVYGVTGGAADVRGALAVGAKEIAAQMSGLANLAGDGPLDERILRELRFSVDKDGRPSLSPYGLETGVHGHKVEESFAKGVKTVTAIARALIPVWRGVPLAFDEQGAIKISSLAGGNELFPHIRKADGVEVAFEELPKSEVREGKVMTALYASHMVHALRAHHLPVILVDATLDLEIVQAVTEQPTPIEVVDVAVRDGAPIERVWLHSANATRKSWLPHDRVDPEKLIGPFRRALEIVAADPARKKLGVVTFQRLAAHIETVWKAVCSDGPLTYKAEWLAGLLRAWHQRGGELLVLYYGNTRGDNSMQGVDALLTLGDPRPNVDGHQALAEVLEVDFDATYLAAARAELEQAHGRLRAPWRQRPALALHVGAVPPGGWEREATRIELVPVGRPGAKAEQSVRGDVLRGMREAVSLSIREAARILGVSARTLGRLEAGGCGKLL